MKKCFLLIFGALFFRSEIQAGAKLSLNRQFVDERWSKHRVVTCLDWSPQVIFLNKVFMVKPTRAWLIVDVTDVMFAVILKSLSINFHKHVGHSPLKLLLDYAQF